VEYRGEWGKFERDDRQREQGEGVSENTDLGLSFEKNILFILVF
jgi:hypothetical protein